MLKAEYYSEPSELDMMIFEKLIPAEHYLRKLKAAIDFEPLRALVAECYAAGMGAPAEDPVRLLKLSLLQFHEDRTWMPRPVGGEEKSSRRRRVSVRRPAWQASARVMRSTRLSII